MSYMNNNESVCDAHVRAVNDATGKEDPKAKEKDDPKANDAKTTPEAKNNKKK